MGIETTAARAQRAREKLAETQAELASVRARIAEHDQTLAALDAQVRQASAKVAEQERAQAEHDQAVTAAQAAHLVALGTDDEAEASAGLNAATAAAAEGAKALAAARKGSDKVVAQVTQQRADVQLVRHKDASEAQRLEKLLAALEREAAKAHTAHGRDVLSAAREERAAALARLDEAERERAAALADLDAHMASIPATFAPWDELRDEWDELQMPVFEGPREVLGAFIGLCESLQRNAGSGVHGTMPQVLTSLDHATVSAVLAGGKSAAIIGQYADVARRQIAYLEELEGRVGAFADREREAVLRRREERRARIAAALSQQAAEAAEAEA